MHMICYYEYKTVNYNSFGINNSIEFNNYLLELNK